MPVVRLRSPRRIAGDREVFEADTAALLLVEGETSPGGGVRAMTAGGIDASSSGMSLLLSTYLLSLRSEKTISQIRISVSLPMLRRESISRRV